MCVCLFTHGLLKSGTRARILMHVQRAEDAQTKTGARGPSCTHPGRGNDDGWRNDEQEEPVPPPFPTPATFCLFSPTSTESLYSPEPRKGYVSSLSLSPSGPAAAVPRSNRDVPLPESGKRGNRDWMACVTKKWFKKRKIFDFLCCFSLQISRFQRCGVVQAKVTCWQMLIPAECDAKSDRVTARTGWKGRHGTRGGGKRTRRLRDSREGA